MDNTTILFNTIQRTYRNAVVELIRDRMCGAFESRGIEEIRKLFAKKDPESGKTYWQVIKEAAQERRSGGTGEFSTPIRDEYELLGVEHFFNVFDKHFDLLCPAHAQKPKKEKNQARQTLTTWMKQIKNIRDPISHPVTDDVDYEDAAHVLYCARKILDFCMLSDASAQVLSAQSTLLGGLSGEPAKILDVLPPPDEVVMEFVGRHRELAALNEWLRNQTARRWALSGEGGKGKSAIAYAFAKSVASRDDHGLDAVIWMSAKRRRFIEGQMILVDRPDFHDRASAVRMIIQLFGDAPTCDPGHNEQVALSLLTDFPSLVVVDDIDTVEAEGEDAIQFLVMTIPERTPSLVLVTSRRAIFGLANLTTQVEGLSPHDGEAFVKSRCDLMGISAATILPAKDRILEATGASPLFIEDLLRLSQSGLPIDKAIGLWAEKRGTEARKYAIQREYDQLEDDAKQVLLALSLQGPCKTDHLCTGLNWSESRLLDALQQLNKMFLMPQVDTTQGKHVLALNRNIRALVLEVFGESEAYRRTMRVMQASSGELKTKRSEDRRVDAHLRRARLLVNQARAQEAEVILSNVLEEFPGRADVYATLAWANKRAQDWAAARMHFKRAHELGSNDRDTYWHWSEMEAANGEWRASAQAAELGLTKFPGEQGLLFRYGYALHRQGKELIVEERSSQGVTLCRKGQQILEKALVSRNAEDRNFSLRNQIFRAIVLNLEVMDEGAELARRFAEWSKECPDDRQCTAEYERLRQKYPQYLRQH